MKILKTEAVGNQLKFFIEGAIGVEEVSDYLNTLAKKIFYEKGGEYATKERWDEKEDIIVTELEPGVYLAS